MADLGRGPVSPVFRLSPSWFAVQSQTEGTRFPNQAYRALFAKELLGRGPVS